MSILAVILAFVFAVSPQAGSPSAAPASQVPASSSQTTTSKPYHVVRTMPLPFLKRLGGRFAFEATSRRLFIPDGKDLIVINADTGETVGTIPKIGHASDIAFAPDLHRAFVVDSEHGGLVIVDLQNLTVLERARKVAESFMALYDGTNKKLFVASAQSKDCEVFDPLTNTVIASVKLGGYPIQGLDDSQGHIYFELGPEAFRDPRALGLPYDISPSLTLGATGEIAILDGQSLHISGRWKEPSCTGMRLIGIDHANQRIFAGCRDSLGTIDSQAGGLALSTPIPAKPLSYFRFDEELGDLFAVTGPPTTLIVTHENSTGGFDRPVVVAQGSYGTMVADGRSGALFVLQSDERLVDNRFYLEIPGTGLQPMKVPEPVPGTFRLIVYSKN